MALSTGIHPIKVTSGNGRNSPSSRMPGKQSEN
ncbi:hypothetical protein GBAR_LOCUS12315 [Geodia barretti]|uniref:Uncharacterized protein n=1 Tax=Geodia barretti TaxID=519541 RepID=A0AA35S0G1_GEOBA|nr:hypothetical protein GBAR_LOCUS12315 [Geodia barretti]